MTPLAMQILKDTKSFVGNAGQAVRFYDAVGIIPKLLHGHCFEVTQSLPFLQELAASIRRHGNDPDMAFLPFPVTWLEMMLPEGRVAFLIEHVGNAFEVRVVRADQSWRAYPDVPENFRDFHPTLRRTTMPDGRVLDGNSQEQNDREADRCAFVLAALTAINTPRAYEQRTHEAHRGLARELNRRAGRSGLYPLKSWSEIRINTGPPKASDSSSSSDIRSTGERPRHWVRAHPRVRLGRIEIVPAHQRGNPAFGTKQSRYRLTAPAKPLPSKPGLDMAPATGAAR